MPNSKKNKILDLNIFSRIMSYAMDYKALFVSTSVFSISLAIISTLRPYLMINGIDNYVYTKTEEGFLNFAILILIALIAHKEILIPYRLNLILYAFVFLANTSLE